MTDAIDEAYYMPRLPKESSSQAERGIRKDRASVQSVRKLSPEEYQKEENEGRSDTIAGRAAWEASTPKQQYKIAGYGKRKQATKRARGKS